MPRRRVDIEVAPSFRKLVSRTWLRRLLLCALGTASARQCQVSLVVTDDDTIKMLNRQYRGLDEITDVLSFATNSSGDWEGQGNAPPHLKERRPFVLPDGEPHPLGEVIISYQQAARQADNLGHTVEKEISLLIVHGMLHLLSYDHTNSGEETRMKTMEAKILARLSKADLD